MSRETKSSDSTTNYGQVNEIKPHRTRRIIKKSVHPSHPPLSPSVRDDAFGLQYLGRLGAARSSPGGDPTGASEDRVTAERAAGELHAETEEVSEDVSSFFFSRVYENVFF